MCLTKNPKKRPAPDRLIHVSLNRFISWPAGSPHAEFSTSLLMGISIALRMHTHIGEVSLNYFVCNFASSTSYVSLQLVLLLTSSSLNKCINNCYTREVTSHVCITEENICTQLQFVKPSPYIAMIMHTIGFANFLCQTSTCWRGQKMALKVLNIGDLLLSSRYVHNNIGAIWHSISQIARVEIKLRCGDWRL